MPSPLQNPHARAPAATSSARPEEASRVRPGVPDLPAAGSRQKRKLRSKENYPFPAEKEAAPATGPGRNATGSRQTHKPQDQDRRCRPATAARLDEAKFRPIAGTT